MKLLILKDQDSQSNLYKTIRKQCTIDLEPENLDDEILLGEEKVEMEGERVYNIGDRDIFNELDGMQSPISRRKEIMPELDELEE
jgi:hypothetical protein